jgi:arabinofuranosyltransferase
MTSSSRTTAAVFLAFLILFLTVLIRTAWVCDDAYISFRSVDNFVHGYGLNWNVDERVQSFTNPLWVLVMSLVYGISGEMYYTVIFFSIALTLVTVGLLVYRLSLSRVMGVLALVILLFSKAFIDYSTSGLENVLVHLLLVIFLVIYFSREMNLRTLRLLSCFGALAILARIDVALLILPVIAWSAWELRSWRGARSVLVGFAPLIIWEIFSLAYYGFPFPNTYYAKLHTGIPTSELMSQAFFYYLDSVQLDPLTIGTILFSVVAGLSSRNLRLTLISLGILLYTAYTIRVGCDFMLGRFLTAPLVCALAIIVQSHVPRRSWTIAVPIALVLLLGLTSPRPPILSRDTYGTTGEGNIDPRGIADERGWYYQGTGLLRARRGVLMPDHEWVTQGLDMKFNGHTPMYESCVGFVGFFAGPKIHIIDTYGLTEPLLARIPNEDKKDWRIGHFPRTLPAGYDKTLELGVNRIEDSGVAKYYELLSVVTRGPIFSWHRFATIWHFNTGSYDSLLSRYTDPPVKSVTYAEINAPKAKGSAWNGPGTHLVSKGGVRIALDSIYYRRQLEISIDHNDMYLIVYYLGEKETGHQLIEQKYIEGGGLRVDTLEIPRLTYLQGYDRIDVRPFLGDDLYSVGHIRLIGASGQ